MIRGQFGVGMLTLAFAVPLWPQEPAKAPPVGRVELRVVKAMVRDTIQVMKGGATLRRESEVGPWLVVSVQVTTLGEGFGSTPTLTGPALATPRQPRGISGDSGGGTDLSFLEYAANPAFVPRLFIKGHPGWVGLTAKGGNYAGAGWIGSDDSLDFTVTTAPQLEFQRAGSRTLTLAFNVSGGKGPYVLTLGGSTVDVSPDRNLK